MTMPTFKPRNLDLRPFGPQGRIRDIGICRPHCHTTTSVSGPRPLQPMTSRLVSSVSDATRVCLHGRSPSFRDSCGELAHPMLFAAQPVNCSRRGPWLELGRLRDWLGCFIPVSTFISSAARVRRSLFSFLRDRNERNVVD